MSCNPFEGLLADSDGSSQSENKNMDDEDTANDEIISKMAEEVFCITINDKMQIQNQRDLVYLEDLAKTTPKTNFDLELLELGIFERILLENPESCVVPKVVQLHSDVCGKDIFQYLANSYTKLTNFECDIQLKNLVQNFIVRNFVLVLKQPDMFHEQDFTLQLVEILSNEYFPHVNFFERVSQEIKAMDGSNLYVVFLPLLKHVHKDAMRSSLGSVPQYIYVCLDIFTSSEDYAACLMDFCVPPNFQVGSSYANTLLGALLSLSVLPKSPNGRHDFFDKTEEKSSNIIEDNLRKSTDISVKSLWRIFMRLLKCSRIIKMHTLNWFGSIFRFNAARGMLWNTHGIDFNPAQFSLVSDGFMINLSDVLVRMCLPFCLDITGKLMRVDPTYCAVPDSDRQARNVHMVQMSKETCLIPFSADDTGNARPVADVYNFVTESFFMAHRALDLGYRVCIEHFNRMNQEIGQVQRSYNDAMAQSLGDRDILDPIKERYDSIMTKYRSLQTVLLAPNFLDILSTFHKATAIWLTQVCLDVEEKIYLNYAPIDCRPVIFPLPETVPVTVTCIPEFVVENTIGYLSFLRRSSPQSLEEQGYKFLEPMLTMVLVFMGSPERMRNPHLRARMAECLEALLPDHNDAPDNVSQSEKYHRKKLFLEHPHRKEIVSNLLNVFVGIEMTGQSVQFEQKFNYRRPMYVVMDYLWQLEEYKNDFKLLARDAKQNMEAVTPPLFLRFINLLLNDAVFLLDDAFSHMAQLRTMQTARQNGDWDNLPEDERTQNLSYMQHTGMIARFDNILGRETIHMLELLTSEITIVFTHITMVDRVAAMLNYFLYILVGPNKKNFKVKDQKEYEFDPGNIVLNICKIYVHLYQNDAFCLAVSQDGRSYSPQLFALAEDVLLRIGGGSLITELQELASKVARLASQHQVEEEILTEAPDEYLDPIMSTVMTDPVILPSSKQTVDRSTIARHLLSDQTDPFNRSPLTMNQVIPNTELLARINTWIAHRREEYKS